MNEIKKYNSLDLKEFVNSNNPIIAVQKSIVENWLDKILAWVWFWDINSKLLKEKAWRSWFFSIESDIYWELWFLLTKWADSTKSFANISDYYLWWTDIWDKVQARGLKLEKKEEILWEILWGYKTELLLLLWEEFLEKFKKDKNVQLDILTTKFTPTLTKKVIEKLPNRYIEPIIDTVDSNSELNIQIQEILNPWNNIWAIEIVQSGASLEATNAYPVKNWIIYEPSSRNKYTWEFNWKEVWKLDLDSQVWIIANNIQSEVNLAFYKILSWKNKSNKFIKVIEKAIRDF